MNPKYLVQMILSSEYKELGQKAIDGVLCEGLETTDPKALGQLPGPVSRLELEMQLWVNAKTKYPVLFEWKMSIEAEGQAASSKGIMDQFRGMLNWSQVSSIRTSRRITKTCTIYKQIKFPTGRAETGSAFFYASSNMLL